MAVVVEQVAQRRGLSNRRKPVCGTSLPPLQVFSN
jgi:hypothetical protein